MTGPDLWAVDELCRLAVAAGRLGCQVHLSGADPRLLELLDPAGVGDVLCECPERGSHALARRARSIVRELSVSLPDR